MRSFRIFVLLAAATLSVAGVVNAQSESHTIRTISSDGGLVVLDDGTAWNVFYSTDYFTVVHWSEYANVILTNYSKLTNTETNETVDVSSADNSFQPKVPDRNKQYNDSFLKGFESGSQAAEDEKQREFEERMTRSSSTPPPNSVGQNETDLINIQKEIDSRHLKWVIDSLNMERSLDSTIVVGKLAWKSDSLERIRNHEMDSIISSLRPGSLSGFWGIAWGSSQSAVMKALRGERNGLKLTGHNADSIWFQCHLRDFSARTTMCFDNGKMFKGTVDFDFPFTQDSSTHSATIIFKDIHDSLIAKYGIPSTADSLTETYDAQSDSLIKSLFSIRIIRSASWCWAKNSNGYQDGIYVTECHNYIQKSSSVNATYISGELLNQFWVRKKSTQKTTPLSKDY